MSSKASYALISYAYVNERFDCVEHYVSEQMDIVYVADAKQWVHTDGTF